MSPVAPGRPCRGSRTARRCPALTTDRSGYCPDCRPEAQRRADATPWRQRAHAFYKTRAWQSCRRIVLDRDKVCILCEEVAGPPSLATIADHWPRSLRWYLDRGLDSEAADPANSRGLCKPCSDRISGEEARRRQLGRIA